VNSEILKTKTLIAQRGHDAISGDQLIEAGIEHLDHSRFEDIPR
jgi:hypothetical protein